MPPPILRSELILPSSAPGATLRRTGVRPRKSRGQNFLVQESIAHRIVAAAQLEPHDHVIEIGPGLGRLTELLARGPIARLTLIELDDGLADGLRERFRNDPRIELIAADFLSIDPARFPPRVKIVGNLPFNVAAAILQRLDEARERITRMVLMFQREVADRIRARPGDREYGALSAFTALYWRITDHFRVAAGSFYPRPKVDAEVLVFAPQPTIVFDRGEESRLLATIRAAFSAPRKTIRNSLSGGLPILPDHAEEALAAAGIDPARRPGMLTTDDFIRLTRALRGRQRAAKEVDA